VNLVNQQDSQSLSGIDETAERTVIIREDELFVRHMSGSMCGGNQGGNGAGQI
jgi:hypothetical protein